MVLRLHAFVDSTTFPFAWLRLMAELGLQSGALGAGDYKLTPAAGGGQRADVAAGVAVVKGTSGTPRTGVSQGLYIVANDASIPNGATFTAANGTNPRIDSVYLTVGDTIDLGKATDDPSIVVVAGTPTANATLDGRNGAPAAVRADSILLADVLIPAASTAVAAGNIRDRRPWARGAFRTVTDTTTGTYTSTVTTPPGTSIPALAQRIECSGVPVKARLRCGFNHSTSGGNMAAFLLLDGSPIIDTTAAAYFRGADSNLQFAADREWTFTPTPGSHLLTPAFTANAGGTPGTSTIYANGQLAAVFTVEEVVRANAANQ